MNKGIINTLIFAGLLAYSGISSATTFTCPTLRPNEIYYYFEWTNPEGEKLGHGAWNQQLWRLWINGDSYLTPEEMPVTTSPLTAHYFSSTHSWYLKCTSGDLSVGPRNNVWPYDLCEITASGFECKNVGAKFIPNPNSAVSQY